MDYVVGLTLTADGRAMRGEVRLNREELERLGDAARRTGTSTGAAGGTADKAGSSFRNAGREARSFGQESQRLGQSIGSVHREMSLLYGVIAAGGITLAARQITQARMAMEGFRSTLTAAVGNQQQAAEELAFVEAEAERLGLSITSLTDSYARLAASAQGTTLAGQGARDIFTAVAEAGAVLKLSADRSAAALRALEQMVSKGTISMEELKLQLGDQLPGAMQIAARSMGMTVEAFTEMVAAGGLMADEFLPKFASEIRKTFGPGVQEAIRSTNSEIQRISNDWFRFLNMISEKGYIDAFNAELRSMQQWLKTTDAKELARDVGETLATALQVAGEAARFLAENLDLVIAAVGALAAAKLIGLFVGLGQAIAAAGIALAGMAAAAPVLAGVAAGVAAVGVAAAASASDTESATGAMSNAWSRVKSSVSEASEEIGSLYERIKKGRAGLDEFEFGGFFGPEKLAAAAIGEGIKAQVNGALAAITTLRDNIRTAIETPVGAEFWAGIEESFRRNFSKDRVAALFAPLKQETERFIDEFQDGQPIFLDVKLAPAAKAEMSKAVRELVEDLDPLVKLYRETGTAALALEKDFRTGRITYEEYSQILGDLGHRVEGFEYQLGQAARAVRDQARETEAASRIRRLEAEDTEEASRKIIELRAARELEKLALQQTQAVMAAQPGQIAELNAAYEALRSAILAARDADLAWSAEQAGAMQGLREQLDPVAAKYQEVDKQSRLLLAALNAGKITYAEYTKLLERLGTETELWAQEQEAAARKVREGAEDLEFSNAIRRLEIEDTEASRQKIIELTAARRLEQLEIEKTQALLAAQPGQVAEIEAAYDRLKAAILDDAQVQQLERIKAQANPLAKAFENAAEGIQRGFSDAFFQIFREGRLRFDDLADSAKDIFARMLAEMATLAIARPIIIPMVQALGGFMGVPQSAINGVTNNLGGTGGGGLGLGQLPGGGGLYSSFATGQIGQWLGLSELVGDGVGGGFAQLTGLGEALGQGFSAAPWGILGGLGANMLGLGGGIGGTIGGAVGSIAGGAAGSAWLGTLLGAAGGPVGAIVGSFLGTALGGLLGNQKPSDKTASFQGLLSGDFLKTEDKADDASRQNRDSIQTALETVLPAVLGVLDVERPDGLYLDVATGARDGNRFWVYDTGGQDLAGLPASARPEAIASGVYDDPEALIGGIIEAITDQVEGLSEVQRTVLDQLDWSDIEAAVSDLELTNVYEGLGQVAETVPEAQAAIDAINQQFQELTDFATKYGLALDPVVAGQAEALAGLETGFVEGLQDQILQLRDPVALQIKQLDEWRKTQIANAAAIGQANGRVGASSEALAAIQELYAIRLAGITGEVGDAAAGLTQVTRAVYLEQISAVEDFRRGLADKVAGLRRLVDQLNSAQLSLLIDQNLSPLGPQARYDEAARQFYDTARRSRLGDQEAAAELPEIARAFLEVSRAFNGDSQVYNADFAAVQTELEEAKSVAQRHLSTSEQQLGRLDTQIALLREQLETDQQLVTTFEEAVGILNAIQGALEAAAQPGGGGGGGGGGGQIDYVDTGYQRTEDDLIHGVDRATRDAILLELGQTTAGGGTVRDRIENDPAFADAYRKALQEAGGVPTFAFGGRIRGGMAGLDSVPLIGMPDEYILRAGVSRAVGYDVLEHINATGSLPRSGGGGMDMAPVVSALHATRAAVEAGTDQQAEIAVASAEAWAELQATVAEQSQQISELTTLLKKRRAA